MTKFARLALAGLLAIAAGGSALADDALKAKIGVLRLSSSAPVFIAQDKGYFREAELDIELKFFDAAQPIAVATASGDVDFGITAFTAGLYICRQGHPEGDRRHEPGEGRLSADRLFRQQ
jgi:NitT/TauT family transport system substrate-binding protein